MEHLLFTIDIEIEPWFKVQTRTQAYMGDKRVGKYYTNGSIPLGTATVRTRAKDKGARADATSDQHYNTTG